MYLLPRLIRHEAVAKAKRLLLSLLSVSFWVPVVSCRANPGGNPLPPLLEPLPQDPLVEVYFNHNSAASYREPYRQVSRNGDDLERLIVDTISSAQSTVDVAVQELRLPEISRALVERHRAGVRVRVILENTYSRPSSELTTAQLGQLDERDRSRYEEYRLLVDRNKDGNLSLDEISRGDALVMLRDAGIPAIDDTADGSKGSGLMHHKFVIVDGRTLIVTSANFTTSDIHGDFASPRSRGNANNLLKIHSRELAKAFTQEFNVMWGDGPGGKPDSQFGVEKPFRGVQTFPVGQTLVAVQFSPTGTKIPWEQSVNGLIAKTLNGAGRSIDMALFVFSEQKMANFLEIRHQGGVPVRALIDPSFAYRSYSEGLDMMGIALVGDNCSYEQGNRPWQNSLTSVGVPQLLAGDKLHHKFGVVDGQRVIAGSHNWSAAANTQNDETLLVIESPTVAAHFVREFERLYKGAVLGVPQAVREKIQNQLKQCPAISTSTSDRTEQSVTAQWSTSQKLNINTASQKELEDLPGVGPKLAARIIEARQQQPFTSMDDLDKVSGVGPKVLEGLRDRVTF